MFDRFRGDESVFDPEGEFVPEHLPTLGEVLERRSVLSGEEHLRVHRIAREVFDVRGVYDMTFGYNLAKLNRDQRHPDAGFRYAESDEGERVLFAEFTPTTPFCPQSATLAVGAFRAWNGEHERHEYDRVEIRVAPMHHESGALNGRLETLGERLARTGEPPEFAEQPGAGSTGDGGPAGAPTRSVPFRDT